MNLADIIIGFISFWVKLAIKLIKLQWFLVGCILTAGILPFILILRKSKSALSEDKV
jgi:hypothetical protein